MWLASKILHYWKRHIEEAEIAVTTDPYDHVFLWLKFTLLACILNFISWTHGYGRDNPKFIKDAMER